MTLATGACAPVRASPAVTAASLSTCSSSIATTLVAPVATSSHTNLSASGTTGIHGHRQCRGFGNDGRVVRLPKAPVFIAKRGGATFNAAYTPLALSIAASHTPSPCTGCMGSSSTTTSTSSTTPNTWHSSTLSTPSPTHTHTHTPTSLSSSPSETVSQYRTSFVSSEDNPTSLHPLHRHEENHPSLLIHHRQQTIQQEKSQHTINHHCGSSNPVVAMEHCAGITPPSLLRHASQSELTKSSRGLNSLHRRHDSTPIHPSPSPLLPSLTPLENLDTYSELKVATEEQVEASLSSSTTSLSARYEYDDDFPSIGASESTAPPAQVTQPLALPLASAFFPHRYNKGGRCRRRTMSPPRKRRNAHRATHMMSTYDGLKKRCESNALDNGDEKRVRPHFTRKVKKVDASGNAINDDIDKSDEENETENDECNVDDDDEFYNNYKDNNDKDHKRDEYREGRSAKRSSAASMTVSERASMGVSSLLRRRCTRRPPSTQADKNNKTNGGQSELIEADSVVAAWRERRTTDAAATDKPSYRRRNRRGMLPLWCGGRGNRYNRTTNIKNSNEGGCMNGSGGAQALGGVAECADDLIRTVLDYDDFMHGRHRSKPHNAALRMLSRFRRRV